ncbi:SLC13 family permease [Sphaerisporangium corydalis]|uniref:SLC13 family permease n=1 Tax=Sphaerisporangium corydalis TaxID=1441875 RepID=A0ABV9E8K9_9ACTN
MTCVKWRLTVLDGVRLGVFVVGLACVATGLLPLAEATGDLRRIGPLLLFLAAVIVLAELTKEANVFDVLAGRLAIIERGNYLALFILCVAFASSITIFLNLDTTAVLLTPVMLALAPRARIAPLPLVMTTIWLANTASLLLPVSNLTNLLAMGRVGLSTSGFAARMWAPQAAAIAVTTLFLWIFFWRRGQRGEDRYDPPPQPSMGDPVLFTIAGTACALFVVAIFAGVQIGVAAAVAAVLVVAAFAWRDRPKLTWALFPWQLLAFVIGLFLVVPTLSRYGLDHLMRALVGGPGGAGANYRAAAAGAGLSNVVNNLPAYYAGERVIPPADRDRLLSLIIGANAGSVVTPWASLATLLWFEWCRRRGVRVPLVKFLLTGAGLAVAGVAAAVTALLLTA